MPAPPVINPQQLAAAIAWLQAAGQMAPRGQDLPPSQHAEDYLQQLRAWNRSPKHIRETGQMIHRVLAGIGVQHLDDITGPAVDDYLLELRSNGFSASRSNHHLQAIRQCLRWCRRQRRMATEPLAYCQWIKVTDEKRCRVRRVFLVEEIQALLDYTRHARYLCGFSGPHRGVMYRLEIKTGLRANEMHRLTAADIELKKNPHVRVFNRKSRETEAIPLLEEEVAVLRPFVLRCRPEQPVFPVQTKQWWPSRILATDRKGVRRWLGLAEDDPFLLSTARECLDFHAFRHTYTTWLARTGCKPKVLQTLARHAKLDTTLGYYVHVDLSEEREALARLPHFS